MDELARAVQQHNLSFHKLTWSQHYNTVWLQFSADRSFDWEGSTRNALKDIDDSDFSIYWTCTRSRGVFANTQKSISKFKLAAVDGLTDVCQGILFKVFRVFFYLRQQDSSSLF